jgi:hypothetical protein
VAPDHDNRLPSFANVDPMPALQTLATNCDQSPPLLRSSTTSVTAPLREARRPAPWTRLARVRVGLFRSRDASGCAPATRAAAEQSVSGCVRHSPTRQQPAS